MSCCDSNALGKNWTKPEPREPYVTGLQVNNSLSGGKVDFVPATGNVVNWYGCGPTVYDSAHMGHARNYVSFDIIRRVMEDYFGYKVNMCMNITDIDDKIIARAAEVGIPFNQLSRFWEDDFMNDMKALNVRLPDVITRVSEFVPRILEFIEGIMKNGYGYESEGSVYFDVEAFKKSGKHVYGRMEPWSVSDASRVLEGEGALGVTTGKRNTCDFALWKKAKAGEPSWPSPWGLGRPGWHIECSAMASDVLGFPLDIHSGGIDLRFPHHDNELAQTEANFDRPQWVNYFLHSGHLHIKGLKMAKSLKNFITVKAILEKYPARVMRMLVLLHRWDQPMNYDPTGNSMTEASEVDRQFNNFFGNMCALLRKALTNSTVWKLSTDVNFDELEGLTGPQAWEAAERNLFSTYQKVQTEVHHALCDNFNTPAVIALLQDLMNAVNVYVATRSEEHVRGPLVLKAAHYVHRLISVFGLVDEESASLCYGAASGSTDSNFVVLMDSVGTFRHKVREISRNLLKGEESKSLAGELLKLCDSFRDEDMVNLGIKLEDKGDKGFLWKQSTKEELLLERVKREEEEKAQAELKEKRRRELVLINT